MQKDSKDHASSPSFVSQPIKWISFGHLRANSFQAYLDVADTKDFVFGMQVWCFADFKTAAASMRPGGMNYKGVFTRDRKPKMAAYFLRSRWNKETRDSTINTIKIEIRRK
ncbi:MAG TPA: glycoside hydrolase family 2 TIM barrel-domain containing protein [Mucilaginibacter sp.]